MIIQSVSRERLVEITTVFRRDVEAIRDFSPDKYQLQVYADILNILREVSYEKV